MVALGFYFIFLFAAAFWFTSKRDFSRRWLLRLFLWSLPLPWVSAELGWFVAEYGRQPWAIDGVLPTFLASSSVSVAQVLFTLCGFVLFYSSLLVVDVMLMRKYVRMGPVEALGPTQPRPRNSRPRREGGSIMHVPVDYEILRLDLVAVPRRAADRLRHHGRLRPRRRHAAALRGEDRHRAPHRHQHHRPGLGRQSGLVHPRRRRDLRGVSADLCGVLLRLLHRHVPRARVADPAAGRLRIPQQGQGSALARLLGLRAVRRRAGAVAGVRRRLRQCAAGRAVPHRQRSARVLRGQRAVRTAQSVRAAVRPGVARHADDARRRLPDQQGGRPGQGARRGLCPHRRAGDRRAVRSRRPLGRVRHQGLCDLRRGGDRRTVEPAAEDGDDGARAVARQLRRPTNGCCWRRCSASSGRC